MAIYEYRCEVDGAFEVTRPLGAQPVSLACPACASEARRVFSTPMLTRAPRALVAAIDRANKSRYEPEVVTSLPSAGARRVTPMAPRDPRLQRLPRP